TFTKVGHDVCCNLGSINIARAMDQAADFEKLIANSIRALDRVSRTSDLDSAPSIKKGNAANHAVGLGAMNLHGFLATNHIYYDSQEAIDFTDCFFYAMAYYAFKASNHLAKEKGTF
ncbi:TPA: class 1b ribonucleoside-diphosphate reductase subunit alpha, partial [Streptococcus agalactiae]